MSELEEVIENLWLHNTFTEDPWTVDRAFAAIRDDGEVAIDGLIWALEHKDLGLKLLARDWRAKKCPSLWHPATHQFSQKNAFSPAIFGKTSS